MLADLLKNKNIKNGLWMYVLQAFNTIIPLFTIPYITRLLGTGRYGVFSIALNIIGYLQVLVEYGFEMSATREVAVSKDEKGDICALFTSVIVSRMLLMVLAVIIGIGYLIAIKADATLRTCFFIMLICLMGYCIQQNWLFQGMQEMKYITIVSVIARITSTALIFLLVKRPEDLALYCLLYTVSPLLSGIIGFLIARIRYRVHFVRITFSLIAEKLKTGWYVFTTQLSSRVFASIGITFLGIFAAESEVGIYSAVYKLPQLMIFAWSPISQVMYPVVSQRMGVSFPEGEALVRKIRNIFLPVFIVLCAGICLFAKQIVGLAFGAEYLRGYYWVYPMMAWIVLSIANNFMGIQTLLASSHDREYSVCFQIGVVTTIVLNYVLIRLFHGDGASIAPMISEAVLSVLLIIQIRRIRKSYPRGGVNTQ